jgi:hypothetical protein
MKALKLIMQGFMATGILILYIISVGIGLIFMCGAGIYDLVREIFNNYRN